MKQTNTSTSPGCRFFKALAVYGLALSLVITGAKAQTYLMPTGPGGGKPDDGKQPFDPNPMAPGSPTKSILTYGADANGNQVPVRTIRITNNTKGTVYPMMRDPNAGAKTDKFGFISIYDPFDAHDQEYRGYIGYKGTDGQYYFGLQPGQSILVKIPLVFWNGGRISVSTDATYLTATKGPNPFNYDGDAMRSIAAAEKSADTIPNGVVMWYRSPKAVELSDDIANALAEFTIRDHTYLSNMKINGQTNDAIPDGQLVTLLNYDVSNVDTLYMPMAIAALDAWVNPGGGPDPQRTGFKPGSVPASMGWTGAINSMESLQEQLRAFTAPSNTILGEYFGGNGWPYYNLPNPTNDPNPPIKIPAGANIFPQSPLNGVTWSYNDGTWESNKYLLSSGGTNAIFVGIGLAGADVNNKDPNPSGSTVIQLAQGSPNDVIAFLKEGFVVADSNPVGSIVAPGTTVTAIDVANKKVTLSKPTTGPGVGPGPVGKRPVRAFVFNRPVDDYAVDAITKLWFSWAEYYRKNWKPGNPQETIQIPGSIDAQSAMLKFTQAHPELVKGMTVSGSGLDNTYGESGPHQSKAVILEISDDKKSITVNRVANKTTNGTYTFSAPEALMWTPKKDGDPGYPLITDRFVFPPNAPAWQDPYAFSQSVYLVMAYMNQVDATNNSSLLKYMQDVIGGNLGYALDQAGKDSIDGKMIQAKVRDLIKSVLRGVPDFTQFPDKLGPDGKTHLVWYPDPRLPTGGQKFNVFNLDPFVRFVHVNLKFSGYGFSLDDDTADIGTSGGTQLQLSIGGPGGLVEKEPYTNQAPFGPVTAIGKYVVSPGEALPHDVTEVEDSTPIKITTNGPTTLLKSGDLVVVTGIKGDTAANGTFQIKNITNDSFELFDAKSGEPVKPNGTTPKPAPGVALGTWSRPLTPYIDTGSDLSVVYNRVRADDPLGLFQGAMVTIIGTPTDKDDPVRVTATVVGLQSTGQLILSGPPKNADGSPIPPGDYTFHYSGN